MSREPSTQASISLVAEILQSITPPILATLIEFQHTKKKTQADIAAEIGAARSTISKYTQTLLNLSVPVLDKDGHQVTVTPDGQRLIEMYRATLKECSIDLNTVDWDSLDMQKIEDTLSPLYRFRSESPYLILHVVHKLEMGTCEQIWEDDLLTEINSLDTSTVESISNQQFNQVLDKFNEFSVINRDDNSITLTHKGRMHGNLCQEIQLTFGQQSGERESARFSGISSTNESTDIERQSTDVSSDETIPEVSMAATPETQSITGTALLGAPDRANAFRGGFGGQENQPTPQLGPVVCVQFGDDVQPVGPVNGDSASEVARTLRTLATKIEELDESTNESLRVGVFRSLVRDGRITPLGNDWQNLSDAGFTEWQMINKALELVTDEL